MQGNIYEFGTVGANTEAMCSDVAKEREKDIPVEIGSPEFQDFAGDQVLAAKSRAAAQSGGGGDRVLRDHDDDQGLHTIGPR